MFIVNMLFTCLLLKVVWYGDNENGENEFIDDKKKIAVIIEAILWKQRVLNVLRK